MFNNSLSSDHTTLSEAIQTVRLHKEAIDRYQQMFPNSSDRTGCDQIRPSLLESRFSIITRVVEDEERNAERIIAEAFRKH